MNDLGKRILFQGDSITDCGRSRDCADANTALGPGYVNFIAGELLNRTPEKGLQIYNRGISGHRVVDLYARWKIDALNLKPDLISILIGVNDTWHGKNYDNGVEPERYQKIYRMLLEWTKAELPAVKLVLCQPFVLLTGAVSADWLPEVAHRGEIVKSLAEEFGAVYVPFQEVFSVAEKKAPANYWLGDGVHPTVAGHKLMAETWLEAVSRF
ncbi:MAG: SGNH/GDSL hydrolase family protein [Victivallales bacterium]|nr:SGNH/GDSL hydrolase family protein [Victivallales bacterium]